nr:uncharacterized protein LOC128702240 [Cherax quadricarinatus]
MIKKVHCVLHKDSMGLLMNWDEAQFVLAERDLRRRRCLEASLITVTDTIEQCLRDIAGRMRALEESRSQAAARAEELRGRLSELSADLQRFVARCSLEDLDLCNTLDYRGLELGARFHSFSFSEQLRLLAIVENHNLTDTARRARYEYENIPNYVKVMTRPTREEVKRVVRGYRASLYSKVRNLDHMAFDLEVRTKELSWRVEEATSDLNLHENYRWYTVLVTKPGPPCSASRELFSPEEEDYITTSVMWAMVLYNDGCIFQVLVVTVVESLAESELALRLG